MYSRPSAPKTLGGVCRDVFDLYLHAPNSCWPLALMSAAVVAATFALSPLQEWLLNLSAAATTDLSAMSELRPSHVTNDLIAALTRSPAFWVTTVMSTVSLSILFVAMLVRMTDSVDPRKRTTDVILHALRLTPKFLLATAIYSLATSIGLLLLIVPGLIWMISLLLSAAAIVAENAGVFASFQRSRVLVKGAWWHVSGVVAVVTTPAFLAFLFTQTIASSVVAGFGGAPIAAIELNWLLATFLLMPLHASMLVVLYYDLKARNPAAG